MLIPRKNRLAILTYLFKEGALVTSKELVLTPHRQVPVPNLHVVKLIASLKSKGVVRERFSWQYLYYVLTDEGIEYLRNYLHLPEDTVPTTLKKPSKPQPPSTIGRRYDDDGEGRGRGRGRGGRGGGRGGYRKDDMGAPRGFNPEFAGGEGGEGRGRGRGRGGFGRGDFGGGRGDYGGERRERSDYGGGRGDFGGGRGDFGGGRGGRGGGRGRGESSTEA